MKAVSSAANLLVVNLSVRHSWICLLAARTHAIVQTYSGVYLQYNNLVSLAGVHLVSIFNATFNLVTDAVCQYLRSYILVCAAELHTES